MSNRYLLIIRIAFLAFFLSDASISYSQSVIACDLKFIDHLVSRGDFKEALFLLDSTDCSTDEMNDSANYLRGWSLYSLKRLTESSMSLIKVKPSSSFYYKSRFFAAYNHIYTGDYKNALDILGNTKLNTEKQISLTNFEISGIYLLQGDMTGFQQSFNTTNRTFYEISQSSDLILKISEDLNKHKSKSPFFAGLLSGVIPGSGKFYAGKKGEAISSFISTTGLGLITWENYRKNGLNNFATLAFGTAFALSYIANIYGAVVTVSIMETEYRDNVKNSILFNLHIPLRIIFDK
jgi:hypothetical protein